MDGDAEWPDVFTEKFVTARKIHCCCECEGLIMRGQRYSLVNGHWPGGLGWKTYKTCLSCYELRDKIKNECDWGIPPFGELMEWAEEAGFDQ